MAAQLLRLAAVAAALSAAAVCALDATSDAAAAAVTESPDSRYKTLVANSTLVDMLLDPARDPARSSETYDMLHARGAARLRAGPAFPQARPDPARPAAMQAELLQGGERAMDVDAARTRSAADRRGSVLQGAMPGIMVGLTCVIVLLAYVALVAFKRYHMTRSGYRHELLHTEEAAAAAETIDV